MPYKCISNFFFLLTLLLAAALNLVAWLIIFNIRIPLIDFKSAATTLLNSFEREKLTTGLKLGFLKFKQT